MFEIVDGRQTDDGRTPEYEYTISSPCEPEGSGELTTLLSNALMQSENVFEGSIKYIIDIYVFKIYLFFYLRNQRANNPVI